MLEGAVSYFTSWSTGVVGHSHLLTALVALRSGAWARKGAPAHVAWGYVYVISNSAR